MAPGGQRASVHGGVVRARAAVRGIDVAPPWARRLGASLTTLTDRAAILVVDGRWREVTPNRADVAGVRRWLSHRMCAHPSADAVERERGPRPVPAILELWLEQIGATAVKRQPQLQDRGGGGGSGSERGRWASWIRRTPSRLVSSRPRPGGSSEGLTGPISAPSSDGPDITRPGDDSSRSRWITGSYRDPAGASGPTGDHQVQAHVRGLGQILQQRLQRVGRAGHHQVIVVDQHEQLGSVPP
jgi:hypothetical protein